MDHGLEALIAEVESKFIDAEDALSELRHALRQLKSYRPATATSSQESIPVPGDVAPSLPVSEERAFASSPEALNGGAAVPAVDEAAAAWPSLDEETVGVPFWNGSQKDEPPPEPAFPRRDLGMDSTSEGSWPIVRPASAKEPAPAMEVSVEPVSDVDEEEEHEATRRDEVARIVAEMRDTADEPTESMAIDEPDAEETAALDEEEQRRDVAGVVSDLRDSLDLDTEVTVEVLGTSDDDDKARRQDVARMVAQMRTGDAEEQAVETPGGESHQSQPQGADWTHEAARVEGLGATEPEMDAAVEEEDEATRNDVASIVAQMRAESDDVDAGDVGAEAEDPDEEVRDEVRRAVEAARAEMASGYKDGDEGIKGAAGLGGDNRFSFPDWQSTRVEPSGPPVIVIKDSEGRVELARVYDTLSRVECDENAALLNYTPHSVTVGLNSKASVPEVEVLTDAVKAAFGRECEVDSDGVRVNVQIGKDLKGKHSAA